MYANARQAPHRRREPRRQDAAGTPSCGPARKRILGLLASGALAATPVAARVVEVNPAAGVSLNDAVGAAYAGLCREPGVTFPNTTRGSAELAVFARECRRLLGSDAELPDDPRLPPAAQTSTGREAPADSR